MKKIINILFVLSFAFCIEKEDVEYSQTSFSMIKSMILPGWGELDEYKKHQKDYILQRSRLFFYLEGAIVLSYLMSNNLSESYEDDYRTYGTINAEVDWSGKNNAFAINVGKFNDTNAYNTYCNSPLGNCDTQYDANDSSYWWQWDEASKRYKYSDLRNDSEELKDLATLMIAGVLINRLASVFDVISIKKKEEDIFSFNVKRDIKNTNLIFSYKF